MASSRRPFLSREPKREWDQPPKNMRPPGSLPIKDYAIETPLKKSSEGQIFHEVKINLDPKSSIAAVNFVLKDEETGAWYQHRGRDFKVPLVDYILNDGSVVGVNGGFNIWPGAFLPNMLLKSEEMPSKDQDSSSESKDTKQENRHVEGFYEEQPITKQVVIQNSATVSVTKCPKTAKNLLYLETDLPGEVVVHWGVCRDDAKNWEISAGPHPPGSTVFKNKALRTLLLSKDGGNGCSRLFTLDEEYVGFLFVLKLNDSTWLKCEENDFYIPLSSSSSFPAQPGQGQSKVVLESEKTVEANKEVSQISYTDDIISEIRNLVNDISSEKSRGTKTKGAQESILQEIEKLAAEAYSIFRSSIPTFAEEAVSESERQETPTKICSGSGTGFEIVLQGFNWESHKSGRWYMELKNKAAEISSLGFTVIWLPPPTESVSPEGYMPKDLYNLNSRYGSIDELKDLVKCLHEVGLKVLGDAVLNHRCAHYQNQNGVWNLFGGRLNWDDRAIVADDPHFQGRGNKSSGDNFHAAPNIDHSQDFVRKDLKEWLCWLRDEIGYDGWRLDFVRGFWGGYVKDYVDATEPYFAVGEYWDSLGYTYGEMDHNQDAHRQRIIDWINATNGTAGAFDVTTKGILHSALERCEYWRLSDQRGKPPGVMGWWPSRAVTFIENHDTGSTQGHWRFPNGKEMQGYAYILTHPGTPAVFYDHIFSHYQSEIASLISLRNRKKIHCRSTVKTTKAERDVYAAIVDEKVAVKIGPGHYEPPSGSQSWFLAIEGKDYKVWEAS
ncbi:alpha-amylase 3, chloroplastic isoform X2 [Hevea brasiliensis]|uniref:alpha-amylase 3, chloroplastic isoform X2 n=1 Tax=Hevea brasiliensis TaxID=3981 RepID=UPI0025EC8CB9|nr:alpha-amylase 3, chloroplastic isoform X2 [Hevea brasiliensis]